MAISEYRYLYDTQPRYVHVLTQWYSHVIYKVSSHLCHRSAPSPLSYLSTYSSSNYRLRTWSRRHRSRGQRCRRRRAKSNVQKQRGEYTRLREWVKTYRWACLYVDRVRTTGGTHYISSTIAHLRSTQHAHNVSSLARAISPTGE